MKRTIGLLVGMALMAAAGCGSKADNVRAKVTDFKDRMCACKDVACATAVNDDAKKWFEEIKAAGTSKADFSEEDRKAIGPLFDEEKKCAKALGVLGL